MTKATKQRQVRAVDSATAEVDLFTALKSALKLQTANGAYRWMRDIFATQTIPCDVWVTVNLGQCNGRNVSNVKDRRSYLFLIMVVVLLWVVACKIVRPGVIKMRGRLCHRVNFIA
jgi:hypothetical protein